MSELQSQAGAPTTAAPAAPASAKLVRFQIQGQAVEAAEGASLLEAVRAAGYEVPSLCHHEAVKAYGACRLCLVEVKAGRKRRLTTSCNYPVQAGIEVFLDTDKVQKHRRVVLQLLLAMAPGSEAVKQLAAHHGVIGTPYERAEGEECILCGLCTRVCKSVVGADAIGLIGRGVARRVGPPFEDASSCIGCGACVEVCPTQCIGMSEEAGVRRIERWGAELQRARCSVCSRPIAPEAQLAWFASRTGMEPAELAICPDCRAVQKKKASKK